MEAADVGIDDGEKPSSSSDDEMSPKSARLLPALAFEQITYVHIHQCDDFSVRAYRRLRRVWLVGLFVCF
jgi:plant cysteine oxidase